MFFIPGQFISIITFPGVIIHELAHQLFCRFARVAVLDVCYLRTENPVGYVIHENPKNAYQQLLIGIGPLFVNTVLGAIIAAPASVAFFTFNSPSLVDYFLLWLGISIAMHSFPSTGDAQSLWTIVKTKSAPVILRIIVVPIVGIIYIFAFGSFFWLDAAYGVFMAAALPNIIVSILS